MPLMINGDPLLSTVVLLSAGVAGLAVARYARISPIVGFFILGAIIGPDLLGLIDRHTQTIHFLGELGVSFLLFDIGLHLSLRELRREWRRFFLAGFFQFLAVASVLSLLIHLLGVAAPSAMVLGAILSLSSTALVLKILSDEREDSSPAGKRATEVLVFQDITAILLLVLLTGDLSKGISFDALGEPLLKMLLAAGSVILIGRLALKPLFGLLLSIKSDEVITAFALLLVFLASWGTQSLGLSLALGAFLGGLALSESSYSYLVRAEVAPFRSLLLSLFFLSVGINLSLPAIIDNLWLLAALLAAFSAAKVAANWIAFRAAGIERGLGTLLAFLLAQGSEFAFVLLAAGFSAGIIDSYSLNLGVSLVGLSLAVTPFLAAIGCFSSRSVCHVSHEKNAEADDAREVIIVRIDEFGRQLASLLEAERIPYRAHDNDLQRLAYAKSRGLNVFYSDIHRPRTLGRVSLGKALAVVSLHEEEHIIHPLIEGLQKIDRTLPVIAATESPARLELYTSLGLEHVFIKNEASIPAMFEALLRSLGFQESRIEESLSRALQLLQPEGLYPQVGSKIAAEAAA
ncbi:MAG: hypothetical protein DCC75_05760 [Proteobacteria bacterium]|nr:MAG: hypothetical protein DCC75_05760 [Pseudomonadota bacterium]